METIEYHALDKSTWGPGPWQDEPDKVQWQDEATGLPCLAKRGNPHIGAWCGYVGVPPEHELHGIEYSDEDVIPEELHDVHGCLTFSGGCNDEGDEATSVCHIPAPGEPDNVWWLGFDCGHAFDLAPAMRAVLDNLPERGEPGEAEMRARHYGHEVYRDLDYVKAECAKLAAMLA